MPNNRLYIVDPDTGEKYFLPKDNEIKWRQWAKPDKNIVKCAGWSKARNLWKVLTQHYLPSIIKRLKLNA